MTFRAICADALRFLDQPAGHKAFPSQNSGTRPISVRQARDMLASGVVAIGLAAGTATAALMLGDGGDFVRPVQQAATMRTSDLHPAQVAGDRDCARLAGRIIVGDDKSLRERKAACGQ